MMDIDASLCDVVIKCNLNYNPKDPTTKIKISTSEFVHSWPRYK